jgi:hypothetical protein
MITRRTAVVVIFVAVVAAGCGGSSHNAATPSPLVAATTAPAGTPSPVPAVLYAKQGADQQHWQIVQYDLAAGRQLSSFEVGMSLEESPQQAVAGDGRVIVNLYDRIVSYAFDGSDPRELRHAQPGGAFIGIAISPDRAKLALTEQTTFQCPTPAPTPVDGQICTPYRDITQAVVLDALSGREILKMPQTALRQDEYAGQFAIPAWRDDGRGFTVFAYTYSEYFGGLATIMLDGTVRRDPFEEFPRIAPNQRFTADGHFTLPCGLGGAFEMHELILRDLDTTNVTARVDESQLSIEPLEWSPDSGEFLYSTYRLVPNPARPGCLEADESTRTWHVLHADGSGSTVEMDQYTVRRRWYGSRLVEYQCESKFVPEAYCLTAQGNDASVAVSIGGIPVTSATGFRLLAFLDP